MNDKDLSKAVVRQQEGLEEATNVKIDGAKVLQIVDAEKAKKAIQELEDMGRIHNWSAYEMLVMEYGGLTEGETPEQFYEWAQKQDVYDLANMLRHKIHSYTFHETIDYPPERPWEDMLSEEKVAHLQKVWRIWKKAGKL